MRRQAVLEDHISDSSPNPAANPAPPARPAPRRRTRLLVLVAVALVCGIAVVAFATGWITFESYRIPVGSSDRGLVVTEADISQWIEGVSPEIEGALEKRCTFDGEIKVEYRSMARGPRIEGREVLDLISSFHVLASASQAKSSLDAILAGLGLTPSFLSLGDSGKSFEEHNEWLSWGDESRCALLLREGRPTATLFVARKDTKLVLLWVSGIAFTGPKPLRGLLLPRLESFEAPGL